MRNPKNSKCRHRDAFTIEAITILVFWCCCFFVPKFLMFTHTILICIYSTHVLGIPVRFLDPFQDLRMFSCTKTSIRQQDLRKLTLGDTSVTRVVTGELK